MAKLTSCAASERVPRQMRVTLHSEYLTKNEMRRRIRLFICDLRCEFLFQKSSLILAK